MMKIDLNFTMDGAVDANGLPVLTYANKGLANLLETARLDDEVKITKYFNWAVLLKTKGILDLDEADILELKIFITKHPLAYVFFKKPVLDVLRETKK